MNVYKSGDVSLEGASFSECTAGEVRLPRTRTLLPPPHTHARTPSTRRKRETKAEGHGVANGGPLRACPPSLAP